jgi:hypothetical protein
VTRVRRRNIQEAQVVRKADRQEDTTQPVPENEEGAHRDPLSDVHPQQKSHEAHTDVAAERQARRERALKAQQEQEAAKAAEQDSESEYETVCVGTGPRCSVHVQSENMPAQVSMRCALQDEESEEESDSSEDEHRMAKPVFVPKADRETVLEKERAELEAMQLKEAEQKRLESRVVRTRSHWERPAALRPAALRPRHTHSVSAAEGDGAAGSGDGGSGKASGCYEAVRPPEHSIRHRHRQRN